MLSVAEMSTAEVSAAEMLSAAKMLSAVAVKIRILMHCSLDPVLEAISIKIPSAVAVAGFF